MTAKNFTLTLNRAHKIASRLAGMSQDTLRAMQTQALPVTVSLPAANLEAKLAERKAAFFALKTKHQRLCVAVRRVREAIGKANGQSGVSDLLAEQAFVSTQLTAASQIVAYLERDAIEANEVPADAKADAYGRYPTADVYALSKDERNALLLERDELQAAAHGVADRVADANRFTVSFELDEDLAKAVGL